MMGLGTIITVLLYLLFVGYLGYRGYRDTKTAADYMVAGRDVHPFVMALSYGATFISTSAIVGFGGGAGMFGMSLLWLTVCNIFAGIFIAFVCFGGPTRKMGHHMDAHTFPELIGRRFDSTFIQVYSGGLIFLFIPLYAAAVLIGGTAFISSQFAINYNVALLFFSVIIAAYVIMGGLKGVMYTDALQGAIMFIGMLILLIASYAKVGGVTEGHRQLTELSKTPSLFKGIGFQGWTSMPKFGWGGPEYDLWWIIVSTIVLGVGIGVLAPAMKKAGTKNPLFLLDEIDKLGADFRGDPSSALLEVLDPEQNSTFNDHYLEVDYDLSDVMFITTANSYNIPGPLLDRMEIISISGYTEHEKLEIGRRYLLEKQLKNHGLDESQLVIEDDVLTEIIRYYTREAGVRGLSRELAKLCRKVARKLVQSAGKGPIRVAASDVEEFLGVRKHRFGLAEELDQVGVVTGLAWTEVGGELLQIETALMPGKGKLTVTGQLGDVMQESIQAALTYVRSRASELGLKPDFHQKVDIHVHVPEGAIPKDGPSAGLAMATSIVSALTGIPVKRNVCMTGEITLRGKALPIGGLKEKLLAAHRGGLTEAIIPEENEKDLKDIHRDILQGLSIHIVPNMDKVLEHALTRLPAGMSMSGNFVPGSVGDIYLDDSSTVAH